MYCGRDYAGNCALAITTEWKTHVVRVKLRDLLVVATLIFPFRGKRQQVRELFILGHFIEVFVDTTLNMAERRDFKELYACARRRELPDFTGINSPYEVPLHPEVRICIIEATPEAAEHELMMLLSVSTTFHYATEQGG